MTGQLEETGDNIILNIDQLEDYQPEEAFKESEDNTLLRSNVKSKKSKSKSIVDHEFLNDSKSIVNIGNFISKSKRTSLSSLNTFHRKLSRDLPEEGDLDDEIEECDINSELLMHRGSQNVSPQIMLELDSSLKTSFKRDAKSFKLIQIPKIDLKKAILQRNDSSKVNLGGVGKGTSTQNIKNSVF